MNVLVSGSHGFIASHLVPALEGHGHTVGTIGREGQRLDLAGLAGADAVIHLAGAGIGDAKWTAERKKVVLESRTGPTTQLAEALAAGAAAGGGPRVLISGSAIGYYGDRGDEVLTEESSSGEGFLAEICRQWEAATAPAEAAGVRVVHIRTGLVLSPDGGALKPLLAPFKLGLGGRLGTGRQYWSWISIDDAVGGIIHALEHDTVAGPLNLTAPNPVPQAVFAKALGHALHRPTILPTPKLAVAARLGKEAAAEMTLAGQRVVPAKLQATGYRFLHPDLGEALDALLAT